MEGWSDSIARSGERWNVIGISTRARIRAGMRCRTLFGKFRAQLSPANFAAFVCDEIYSSTSDTSCVSHRILSVTVSAADEQERELFARRVATPRNLA